MSVKRDYWQYKVENAVSCPYCGGTSVSVKHKEVRYLGENAFGVKKHKMKAYCVCNKCKATGTPVYYIGYSGAHYKQYDEEFLPTYTCGDKAIEAWNTRKPMERIVERLEEEAEGCRKYWQKFDDEDSFGGMNAYKNAILITKEEGGLNENT